MTSQFFNKVVQILNETIGTEYAHSIVEQHCKLMNKSPDDIEPENYGFFVTTLMSKLGDFLLKNEWNILDKRFKDLLNEGMVNRSKVKGFVLTGAQNYVSLKRGKIALNEIRQRTIIPNRFRAESWYPVSILEELLAIADEVMLNKNGTRSRAIGQHVVSSKILPRGQHWFGKDQISSFNAFNNIREILTLNNFSLTNEENGLLLSFEDSVNKNFQEFLMGICDGILEIRNISSKNVSILEKQNGTNSISIRFRFEGNGGMK
jgi:hypothetical protein